MNDRNPSNLKEAVTVSEMAAMCSLSRQRFHELIGTVFPYPVYLLSNGRPIYDRELQDECLRVRRTGRAYYTGEPVIFYRRRSRPHPSKKRLTAKPNSSNHADLIKGLESLGLAQLDERRVGQVVQELFPQGTDDVASGEVIRQVFLRLKRQNTV